MEYNSTYFNRLPNDILKYIIGPMLGKIPFHGGEWFKMKREYEKAFFKICHVNNGQDADKSRSFHVYDWNGISIVERLNINEMIKSYDTFNISIIFSTTDTIYVDRLGFYLSYYKRELIKRSHAKWKYIVQDKH